VPYLDGPLITRRQEKPRVYARNGPAVLAVRRQVLEAGSLYGDDCRPFVMSAADSIDIDGPDELALADLMLMKRR
jgi:CMP-N-acetylneuraminic acid synthetase